VNGREIELSDNSIQYIRALDGDTYEQLSETFDMMPWQFYQYNEVERKAGHHPVAAGEIVYLQPKRSKGRQEWVTVAPGETLWMVSQRTGVSMKAIVRKNRISWGEPLEAGTRLALRWRLRPDGSSPRWARANE